MSLIKIQGAVKTRNIAFCAQEFLTETSFVPKAVQNREPLFNGTLRNVDFGELFALKAIFRVFTVPCTFIAQQSQHDDILLYLKTP
jgi:hypothetical protein